MRYLYLLIILPFLTHTGCSKSPCSIEASCLLNEDGSCDIIWETYPAVNGKVDIYIQYQPQDPLSKTAQYSTQISKGRYKIPADPNQKRRYFTLVFNEKEKVQVSNRLLKVEDVVNFRDLGGYTTKSGKHIAWGKLYRSSQICSLSPKGMQQMEDLGIKTIIDLRSEDEILLCPTHYKKANIINIPITMKAVSATLAKAFQTTVTTEEALMILNEMHHRFVNDFSKEYTQIFTVLSDPNNYPVLIHCIAGKDRTGFAIAMVLAALDIPANMVKEDYMITNEQFSMVKDTSKTVYKLPAESQEAITILLSARKEFIDSVFSEIYEKFGSVKAYQEEMYYLDDRKRQLLESNLLQ